MHPHIYGAGNEIRTRDFNLGKVALYRWTIPAYFWRPGRDSNPRPPAWQAGILTSWTTRPHKKWWDQQGSNLWPPACKAGALPAELWSRDNKNGAGEGDRTLTAGLEGRNSTIELHPHKLVTHRGIEPLLPPWKGGVLTAWPMSHDIKFTGCGGRTWTSDLRVMSPTSCQLLHSAMLNMVPKTGIEPVREYKSRRILSPVRLPVPPLRQLGSKGGTRTLSLSVNSRVLHHWATLEHYVATSYSPRRLPTKYHQRLGA